MYWKLFRSNIAGFYCRNDKIIPETRYVQQRDEKSYAFLRLCTTAPSRRHCRVIVIRQKPSLFQFFFIFFFYEVLCVKSESAVFQRITTTTCIVKLHMIIICKHSIILRRSVYNISASTAQQYSVLHNNIHSCDCRMLEAASLRYNFG